MLETLLETLQLARWEWFRLRRRVSFLILAALALAVPVFSLFVALVQNRRQFVPGVELGYFETAAGGVSAVAPALAIILAALAHAVDLQGGNSRTLAAWGAPRAGILAAKGLTAALLLLAYYLIALALAGLCALALAPHFEGWADGLTNAAAGFLIALLYLSLGIFLAHWGQSTAFTVGVGIALLALEAIVYPIVGIIGEVAGWPVSEITAWSIKGVADGLRGESPYLDRVWYIPIVAAYAAVLTAAALALFRRFDLRPGGD